MLRAAGLVAVGIGLAGAVALIGSDRWLAASYGSVRPPISANLGAGHDEADLLAERPRAALVVATAGPVANAPLSAKAFDVGTRMTVAGQERLNLEIISSQPVAPETGLVDAAGRPLILVTARERGKGTRLIRLLVEADRTPSDSEKSL